ncbi:hypothetical protein R3P38DRAFT_3357579 [Favolaschia claudopus]|uniref:Uncharacterized protein n=1 Tax=Favolaschia claudopus TaxID=2862362 RepID=A0AAW0B778_9AGAR
MLRRPAIRGPCRPRKTINSNSAPAAWELMLRACGLRSFSWRSDGRMGGWELRGGISRDRVEETTSGRTNWLDVQYASSVEYVSALISISSNVEIALAVFHVAGAFSHSPATSLGNLPTTFAPPRFTPSKFYPPSLSAALPQHRRIPRPGSLPLPRLVLWFRDFEWECFADAISPKRLHASRMSLRRYTSARVSVLSNVEISSRRRIFCRNSVLRHKEWGAARMKARSGC